MGVFPDDLIRRVRDANDIAQVVESYRIELRRSGANFVALCPFHREKTPSFNVNPQKQIFKCFGCGQGGDVFSFVQQMERIEFPEAVELLANRAGIEVEREKSSGQRTGSREGPESRKAILWVNSRALKYFEHCLQDPSEGRIAREYLQQRGFANETISSWRLGWAPDLWDGLLETIAEEVGEAKRSSAIQACLNAGLLRRKEAEAGRDERIYDAFRGRVMFPILDAQHRPIGFGGRVLEEKPEAGGKYINTAEGKVFQKRKLLYGLSFAAKEIGLTRTAIVVEGYTDTIMCHQHGIRNVVATLGTSLTREHVALLRRYVQADGRVIAMFDADQAGENATRRAIEIFMEEDVPLSIVRDLDLKDACAFLPEYGAEAFRERLRNAQDSFRFVLTSALTDCEGDVSARATAVGKIMDLVNRSPNAVKRSMMRKEVSAATGVPEESLPRPRPASDRGGERKRGLSAHEANRTEHRTIEAALQNRRKPMEVRLLALMMEKNEWSGRIAEVYPPADFNDPGCAEIARAILTEWEAGRRPDIRDLVRNATSDGVGTLLADIDWSTEPSPTQREYDALLKRIESERENERLTHLTVEIDSAQQQGKQAEEDELLRRKQEELRRRRQREISDQEG